MATEQHEEEYFDLFKPKGDKSTHDAPPAPEPEIDDISQGPEAGSAQRVSAEIPLPEPEELQFESPLATPSGSGPTIRTIGMVLGGGCLLLVLAAVVVFAFVQVFGRKDKDTDVQDTPTPTVVVAFTPAPTAAVVESPLFVPVVSSTDVRVPVALPERLAIGDNVFSVQAVDVPVGSWPDVPTNENTTTWAYGTVVNYVFGLAPSAKNKDMLSALQVGDLLSVHMSTRLVLNFSVDEVTTGAIDEAALFEQNSPRLTLAWLADESAQRIVVTGTFLSDEPGTADQFSDAVIGLVGTPVDQGPVRVTVIETYQVAGPQAGLPRGTGYFLVDLRVENVGTRVLQPEVFQTFVSSVEGERYPLTMIAEQFAHYGVPAEPLAPGETVIGSLGYLVPGSPEDQFRWAFNPLPGSDYWVVIPVSYQLPPAPSPEPPPVVGFARVMIDAEDVFVDRLDGLLDIGLRLENISDGVVQVTEDDISLSSWTDGELLLVAPAPPLPWTIEPKDLRTFQLQFELPSADSALLDVLGYTFSIENLGGS